MTDYRKSPFYVDGPITERQDRGLFYGEDGSRPDALASIRSTILAGLRREAQGAHDRPGVRLLHQVTGAYRIGKTSTVIHAMGDDFSEAQLLHVRSDDWSDAARRLVRTWSHALPDCLHDSLVAAIESADRKKIVINLFSCAQYLVSRDSAVRIVIVVELRETGELHEMVAQLYHSMCDSSHGLVSFWELPERTRIPELLGNAVIGEDRLASHISPWSHIGQLTVNEALQLISATRQKDKDHKYREPSFDCAPFGEMIIEKVGCHPMLLQAVCTRLDDVKRHRTSSLVRLTDAQALEYCIENPTDCLRQHISALIDPILDHYPALRDALQGWARDDSRPPNHVCQALEDRGLCYYKDQLDEWQLPERISQYVRERADQPTVDPQELSVVKEVGVWLWPLFDSPNEAGAGRVVGVLGDGLGRRVVRIIEKARSLDARHEQRIRARSTTEDGTIGNLIERAARKEPESVKVISQDTWGALSRMLNDDDLFSMPDVEQSASNLGYAVLNWGKPPRWEMVARLLAEVRADGALHQLLAEMTRINPNLTARKAA